MSKSKSRNRKRGQMLRQRKKERELAEQEKKSYGIPEKEKKLKAQLGREVQIRNKDTTGEKISDVILQMLNPLLKGAKSFKEEQDIIGFGIIAWNLGVVKASKDEEAMLYMLADFKKDFQDDLMGLLMDFVELKCTEYREFQQFIYDFEYNRKDRESSHLTVVYEVKQ